LNFGSDGISLVLTYFDAFTEVLSPLGLAWASEIQAQGSLTDEARSRPSQATAERHYPNGTSKKLSFTAGSEHAYVRKLASFFHFIILLAKAALSFLTLFFALLVVFQVEKISISALVNLHHSLTTGNSLEVNQDSISRLNIDIDKSGQLRSMEWNFLK
jgi:hypothetical protein